MAARIQRKRRCTIALETLIAGRYSATIASVDLGIMEEGYELNIEARAEEIRESDAYGMSLIDLIHRGGDVSNMFTSLAYKAGPIAAAWPWGSLGVLYTAAAPIARLGSNVAAALVMTAVANTPAAASPATLTGSKTILAPNFPVRLLFNSKLRKVPVRMLYLPSDNTGTGTHFTTT